MATTGDAVRDADGRTRTPTPFVYGAGVVSPDPSPDGRPHLRLAAAVDDLAAARAFYGGALGLTEGRSGRHWVSWDLHGHQLLAHVAGDWAASAPPRPPSDAARAPIFGLVLATGAFHELAARLRDHDVDLATAPHRRLAGEAAEHWAMVVLDPAGNAFEVKAFLDWD